ncbi:MAG: hypothetical protein U5M50_01760 [Sphingobium sp.]|nr:hypothetical protein [Sphingobium sp.]
MSMLGCRTDMQAAHQLCPYCDFLTAIGAKTAAILRLAAKGRAKTCDH